MLNLFYWSSALCPNKIIIVTNYSSSICIAIFITAVLVIHIWQSISLHMHIHTTVSSVVTLGILLSSGGSEKLDPSNANNSFLFLTSAKLSKCNIVIHIRLDITLSTMTHIHSRHRQSHAHTCTHIATCKHTTLYHTTPHTHTNSHTRTQTHLVLTQSIH